MSAKCNKLVTLDNFAIDFSSLKGINSTCA